MFCKTFTVNIGDLIVGPGPAVAEVSEPDALLNSLFGFLKSQFSTLR